MTPGRCPINDSYGMGEMFKLIICLPPLTRPFGEPTRDTITEKKTSYREERQFLPQWGGRWKCWMSLVWEVGVKINNTFLTLFGHLIKVNSILKLGCNVESWTQTLSHSWILLMVWLAQSSAYRDLRNYTVRIENHSKKGVVLKNFKFLSALFCFVFNIKLTNAR